MFRQNVPLVSQLAVHCRTNFCERFNEIFMKILFSLVSFLVAVAAWFGAVLDFLFAKLSDIPRPYLVPARTFLAAYRLSRAYLMGQRLDMQTFRIREYPQHHSVR